MAAARGLCRARTCEAAMETELEERRARARALTLGAGKHHLCFARVFINAKSGHEAAWVRGTVLR